MKIMIQVKDKLRTQMSMIKFQLKRWRIQREKEMLLLMLNLSMLSKILRTSA